MRPQIVSINSGPSGSIPQISNVVCGHTLVLVSPSIPETIGQHVRLPSNCEIGDVVELYSTGSSEACSIHEPSGDSFVNSNGPGIGNGKSTICRKVIATTWSYVQGS